jgi:hypothetical protein
MPNSRRVNFALLVSALTLSSCGGGGAGSSPAVLGAATANVLPSGPGSVAPSAAPSGLSPALPRSTPTPASNIIAPVSTSAGATFDNFKNGADTPTTFVPYASGAFWNIPVSANPTIASYSASVVAHQFPSNLENAFNVGDAGQNDDMHGRFYASASDPLVNVACDQYCALALSGSIHIPAKARPPGGTDAMIEIIQADGTEVDMWAAYGSPGSNTAENAPHDMQTRDWQTGDTITAGAVVSCGNFGAGLGYLPNGVGATAAGYCLGGGTVSAAELASGHINHAIFVGAQCAVGAQYPSESGASTDQCTSGVGPPLGGHEWYDVPCATTQTLNLQPWEKAILCALNQYGGYFGDDGSGGAYYTGGFLPQVESAEPWRDFNGSGANNASYTGPFALLAAQGWTSFQIPNDIGTSPGTRWVAASGNPGGDSWNIWTELGETEAQFASHIHWLDPCSAQGAC